MSNRGSCGSGRSGHGVLFVTKLLAMLSLFSVASAQVSLTSESTLLKVTWDFNISEVIDAMVGDTIEFSWSLSGYHDIYINPSGNCDNTTGSIEVYPQTSRGGAVNYTFLPRDGSPNGNLVFFACHTGDGIHCRSNVNQPVRVFTQVPSTPRPTSPPTVAPPPSPMPTTPPPTAGTPSPTPGPTAPPTLPPTPGPTAPPTLPPTPGPTRLPTDMPSASPVAAASASPSMATMSPSANPSAATASPTRTPTATPSATPTGSPTASPTPAPTPAPTTPAPTQSPSAEPTAFPSDNPSKSPTISPSLTPSIATPSPTDAALTSTVENLEMTLFGVSELTDNDITNWEEVTALYTASFYGNDESGVTEMQAQLEVVSSAPAGRRRTRRRERNLQTEAGVDSVTLTYNQIMTYRLSNPDLTVSDLVAAPFATDDRRNQYVSIYLNNAGSLDSALANVTEASEVAAEPVSTAAPTTSPTVAPAGGTSSSIGQEAKNNEGDGLSTGAIIGIVAASLFVGLLCCLFFMTDRGGSGYFSEEEEEENPYIPPTPGSIASPGSVAETYTANDRAVEHAYFHD